MQVFELPTPRTELQSVCFAPDGRLLAARGFGQVFLVDTVTGAVRLLFQAQSAYALGKAAIGFTANGDVIVHRDWAPRNEILVLDSDSGKVAKAHLLSSGDASEPGPQGSVVYLIARAQRGRAGELARWDPLTGLESRVKNVGSDGIDCLAASANGRWAASAAASAVRVWNLGEKSPGPSTRTFTVERAVRALALSADGAYLAIGCADAQSGGLFVADMHAGEMWRVGSRSADAHRDLAFHPTRSVLAHRGESGEAVLYDVAARTELNRFAWGAGGLTALAFSPDGLRCAAAGAGRVVVWDIDI